VTLHVDSPMSDTLGTFFHLLTVLFTWRASSSDYACRVLDILLFLLP